MRIFKNINGKLSLLHDKPFEKERYLQNLFEKNLSKITDYHFISSEFTIKNSRIDTLAFDPENKSFVIIEYKRSQNISVIDQGISYLNLMLEYKADFIIEYNEKQKKNLKRSDVDWSQSKVIFISSSFTDFQIQASNFKDLPIELWTVKQFEDGIIYVSSIKKSRTSPSINSIKNKGEISTLKELKVYSEEDHLKDKSEDIQDLYITFKNAILNLNNDINIEPKKLYMVFKTERNIAAIHLQKKALKLWINLVSGKLDDPKNLARDVSQTGHWGTGDYELLIEDSKNLEYIMSLVKQAL
ncbi:DUF5655 domain-containing protein [Bisgaard Taxon 10/6]|uniref:DUF5655 domain-containing protein n=1 Tax=Exercitatus varius TaxID=67857 RepID=UPI00294B16C4|nr:DUF5655 domain-containing protein [Exercitatus varius]MDG2954616.1 DUF5655 domain-containing protein [Exercitatus varius]